MDDNMQLGWIDFSNNERNNVLNILELLGKRGILDVLGIASIRDSFSDLFFPGTSTIQTRAKYFLIVPYALKDLELSNETNKIRLQNHFYDTEKRCAKIFNRNNSNEKGIIGGSSINRNIWVKRPPSNVYIAGLRKYGIFNSRMSINSYILQISDYNKEKKEISTSTDKYENDGEDDKYISSSFESALFISPYHKKWIDDLNINLKEDEAEFLKERICTSCPDSMMAYILDKEIVEILKFDFFSDIEAIIDEFPKDIQKEYYNALSFSRFNKSLNVFYNLVVSNDKNKKALIEFEKIKKNYKSISDINIAQIMLDRDIDNESLMGFLIKSQILMESGKFDELKDHISGREVNLKGADRSRTHNSQKYKDDIWFAGDDLQYRFVNARDIIKDIFNGLGISEV